jgi:Fe2+ or Zn2+ uptake regulation protein
LLPEWGPVCELHGNRFPGDQPASEGQGKGAPMDHRPLNHEAIRLILEKAGLRCTQQRLAVYDQLCQASNHPTAEQVFQSVRSRVPRISLATVYKALEALVAIGAATKLTAGVGENSARYDARRGLHYHFRCLRTGTVCDLPTNFDPELITKLDPELSEYLKRNGFEVTGYHLELVGYQVQEPPQAAAVAEQ